MTQSEEKLAIAWLNRRAGFDLQARDRGLLCTALSLVSAITNPRIADLGAGSGNNALSLLPALPAGSELLLIEQHDSLLQECRRRIQDAASGVSLRFIPGDLHQWLEAGDTIHLLCNSALLDLFTAAELENLICHAARRNIPIYSTLNYSGLVFSPVDTQDQYYIALFEQHMRRRLDRGHPLGPDLHATLQRAVARQDNLTLQCAPSHWLLKPQDADFIEMNLQFYQRAIQALLRSAQQQRRFNHWLEQKRSLLQQGRLALRVEHQDYLVRP